ncbi:hypothetical protein [Chryseobacterium sp. 8AT]|uniref:hypothetical protein n=1 Tax=Chryseobacterium sp. 8AT TaxID=2653134 RepID=UPI0012F262B4|nr:hypothetical protein [Chryseobacterium sp. 8AT]VXC58439.1 conserved hypothetical protein [Chryseobacterium sp. 8AT]
MREKYIINKKIVTSFENEIGFAIDTDYTIVLYDKKDGTVMGEVYNKFDGHMEVDINPQYEISPLQIIIFLQYFLDTENDTVWNEYEITNIYIVHEDQSKWKDKIGYVYFN